MVRGGRANLLQTARVSQVLRQVRSWRGEGLKRENELLAYLAGSHSNN